MAEDVESAEVAAAVQMRRFLDMSIDLLGILDLSTTILETSQSWERTFGWQRSELIGTSLLSYFHEDDIPRIESELASLLLGGEAIAVVVRVRAQDGTYRWVQGNARADLEAERIFVTAADITERKELEHRNDALERSNEELERFAYAAAHDLKAPLARIEMALAAAPVPDGDAGQLMEVARRGAERMRQLIEDLLTFASVGTGADTAAAVDLGDLVGQVVADFAATVATTGGEVLAEPLPMVWGQRTLLRQLVQNLVGNALKFARPGVAPKVVISAASDADGVTIRVADNGIGIEPRRRHDVFGVFTRLNADDQYPGSGIGLATCAKVASHHGGHIWLEDGMDGGSTVAVWLPHRADPGA